MGIRDAQNIIKKSDDNHKTGKDRLSVLLLGHHSKQMKEEVVLAEDSDVSEVDGSHDEDLKSEDLQSETGSESKWDGSSEDGFHLDVQEPCDEYDDEHLRYLVHNTTGDGIRFMLTAIEIFKHSLTKFKNSKICRVLSGDVPIVTLKDVYLHRMLLTSYYRMRSYHPYPDKDMIENCLACGATERGSCKCPVLPKSFYVFCRGQCSSGTAKSVVISMLLHHMYALTYFFVKGTMRIICHPQDTSHTLSCSNYSQIAPHIDEVLVPPRNVKLRWVVRKPIKIDQGLQVT